MNRKLAHWEWVNFIIIGALGTLGHFLYQWSGENTLIGAFFAVNESIWEHMKLLFVPVFLLTMLQFAVLADSVRNFFAAKAAALLLGELSIPAIFCTATGMFGKTPGWFNIAIFFLADALTCWLSYRLLTAGRFRGGIAQVSGFLLFWILAFLFIFFTYRPPALPLFIDPLTGLTGMVK